MPKDQGEKDVEDIEPPFTPEPQEKEKFFYKKSKKVWAFFKALKNLSMQDISNRSWRLTPWRKG